METRAFAAQFFRSVGREELDIEIPVGLKAASLPEALTEALSWPKPEGANSVKVLCDGQVVGKPGFEAHHLNSARTQLLPGVFAFRPSYRR